MNKRGGDYGGGAWEKGGLGVKVSPMGRSRPSATEAEWGRRGPPPSTHCQSCPVGCVEWDRGREGGGGVGGDQNLKMH